MKRKRLKDLEKEFEEAKDKHYQKLVEKLNKIGVRIKILLMFEILDGISSFKKRNMLMKDSTFPDIADVTKLDYTQDWFDDK